MTNNWKGPDGQRDTWAGFMHERGKILDVLKDVSNVVVISGVVSFPRFSETDVNGRRIDMKRLRRSYRTMFLRFRYLH